MVDSSARVAIPHELAEGAGAETVYRFVEFIGEHPAWLLQVQERSSSDEGSWRRRLLLSDVREACAIAQLDLWQSRLLYVLLPMHLTANGALQLTKCVAIHQCDEPDSADTCWRISTEHDTVLHSYYGTPLGQEINPKLLWQSTSSST